MKAQDQIRQWAADGGRKLGWIAEQVPVAKSSMSRWMAGGIAPHAVYRNRLAEITGIEEIRDRECWK